MTDGSAVVGRRGAPGLRGVVAAAVAGGGAGDGGGRDGGVGQGESAVAGVAGAVAGGGGAAVGAEARRACAGVAREVRDADRQGLTQGEVGGRGCPGRRQCRRRCRGEACGASCPQRGEGTGR